MARITESQLRSIIKQELKRVLSEGDVESMKDYSKQDKYHASVLKRLYGDNQELKDLAQKGKQKEFAIKLGELVKADDPEATVKFFGSQRWGGSNRFVMSSQAKELFYSMKETEATEAAPVADNPNVLSFKPKLSEGLKKLNKVLKESDRYGLSIEFGDYGCEEMQDAIMTIKNTPKGEHYHGKNDGYSKEEVIAFLNDRINRRCKG